MPLKRMIDADKTSGDQLFQRKSASHLHYRFAKENTE